MPAPAPKLRVMRLSFCVRVSRRLRARLAGERGFSMVEMLATMLILGTVLGGLTSTFVSASKAQLDANRRFRAQEQARLALDQLRRELHCASAVTDVNGAALSPTSTYSAIKITLGSFCESVTPTGFVTWCTQGSGPWALYRIDHAVTNCSTSSGARKAADFLTSQQPFSKPTAPSGVGIQLPTLHVALTVNTQGTSATAGTSRLTDDIALRNTARV